MTQAAVLTKSNKKKSKRKPVSNADFERALHGVAGDEESIQAAANNRGIMHSVCKKFTNLTPEERESCGLQALWRCLSYHDSSFGKKFTTNLHTFTQWECVREVRKKYGRRNREREEGDTYHLPLIERYLDTAVEMPGDDRHEHVRGCIEKLPHDWQRRMVNQYFYEQKSLDDIALNSGIDREVIRQRLKKALCTLRDVCDETLDEQEEDESGVCDSDRFLESILGDS